MNAVTLNHFPASKRAPIKNCILRRAFYRAINSFIKMQWIDYKIILDLQNLHKRFALNLNIWNLYFKSRSGGLPGGVIGLSDLVNTAVILIKL